MFKVIIRDSKKEVIVIPQRYKGFLPDPTERNKLEHTIEHFYKDYNVIEFPVNTELYLEN
ncbi:hypothetical protein CD122_06735 [Staphylococcus rostri]|uniref:Uncharacterized protein n=1 Tax=Staphylococcus rostri TaxID=522262 RepID=A0A2K3YP71_9STAP|nr:hypothetical protein CD122_06735 [Staphylococcus rostri]